MPYKKVEPISVRRMLKQRYTGHHTICQYLRDIYMLTEDEEIKLKSRVAMAMAKKMHERLKKYKEDKEQWDVQQNVK